MKSYEHMMEVAAEYERMKNPQDTPTTVIPENLSGKKFSEAVLNSPEFRTYILKGIKNDDIPPAIICRLMDHAWGKPVDRLEVKDTTDSLEDLPIEQVEARLMERQARIREALEMLRYSANQREPIVH